MTLKWSNIQEAKSWADDFVKELKRPCVVLLNGPMGAGKTQLVKWFLKNLNVDDVVSPTFAIHQQYSGDIDHVDLYRLTSDADLESSGFWDLLSKPNGLLFVEWADRLPKDVWPKNWKKIEIDLKLGKDQAREVEINIS